MPFHIRPFLTLPLASWLLITFLLMSSVPTYAEWQEVSETDSGMTVYIDPDTILRRGDLVKMWELQDYKTVPTPGDTFLSIKGQREFNCSEHRMRSLKFTFFSGHMGRGRVILSSADESKWEPIAPESVGQSMLNIACGKE